MLYCKFKNLVLSTRCSVHSWVEAMENKSVATSYFFFVSNYLTVQYGKIISDLDFLSLERS